MPRVKGPRPTVELHNKLRRSIQVRAVFHEETGKITITVYNNQTERRATRVEKGQYAQVDVILLSAKKEKPKESSVAKLPAVPSFIRK